MTKEQFKEVENVLMGIITDKGSTIDEVIPAVDTLRDFELAQNQIVDEYLCPKVGDECCGEKCSND